jgi:hypothetical protein
MATPGVLVCLHTREVDALLTQMDHNNHFNVIHPPSAKGELGKIARERLTSHGATPPDGMTCAAVSSARYGVSCHSLVWRKSGILEQGSVVRSVARIGRVLSGRIGYAVAVASRRRQPLENEDFGKVSPARRWSKECRR